MALSLPFTWSDAHRLHEPGGEVYVGVRTPGTELPARAEAIREAVTAAGARQLTASDHGERALLAVHDRELLDYLAGAWDAWRRAGLDADPGQDRVVPYLFPHPGLLGALEPAIPPSAAARAGYFAYDTMTLVGPGTWEAARGAADAALSAAGLVAGGEPVAYALCRPPGHHATRSAFGGSCYLNNAALAADSLRAALGEPVALLDLDAHHGNGSQSVFYEDPGVLTASVHVDPAAGWFPHFLGFGSERGAGRGDGANLNVPVEPGSGDGPWLAAVGEVAAWAGGGGARALVIALGVDAAAGDPESPLEVSAGGYREAGIALGRLGLPTVVVQEGGYDLAAIGPLVVAALEGVEQGRGLGAPAG